MNMLAPTAKNAFTPASLDRPAYQSGFGNEFAFDQRLAFEPPHPAAVPHFFDVIMHGVAWNHGPAESGAVDRHEVDERRLAILIDSADTERSGRLRHALDQQHARHDRMGREMALKKRLVYRHILDPNGRPVSVHLYDSIDQKKRITVGKKLENAGDVGGVERRRLSRIVHRISST